MRRRALLHQDVIRASRYFVCVRLNAWLDEANIQRHVKLQGYHQNSALALLAPDAPGLAADDFPSGDACAWGPFDFGTPDVDEPWKATEDKIDRLPGAMRRLAKRYPGRPEAAASRPVLPVFPDLVQALNMAACDSRAVLAVVADPDDAGRLDGTAVRLLSSPRVVGRVHVVRVSPGDWRAAHDEGRLTSPPPDDPRGVHLVAPDPYGLEGAVTASWPGVPAADDVVDGLREGLDRFREAFVKQDRSTHIIEGLRAGIRWTEHRPGAAAAECEPEGAGMGSP